MAVSNGNETGPVVVAPRRSHEALAVARHVPSDRTYSPWGMLAAIDLHGCERSRLEDPGTLRRFVPSLINAIGMRAHGPLMLDRFGDRGHHPVCPRHGSWQHPAHRGTWLIWSGM